MSGEPESGSAPGPLRTWVGAVGAPAAFAILWLAPLPLETEAHRLAAIFGAVLVAWVTEVVPIAVTALLIAPLLVVTGVTDAKDAFRHYADPLLYLFVGGFFIAEAMSAHGLDRRIAKAIVTSRGVAGEPNRIRIALMVAGGLLSMWISNTASTAILVPILLGMLGSQRGRAATGALLALAYACSIGGLGTLVGSPPNVITVRLLREGGAELTFFDWTLVGVPTALVVGLAVYVVTRVMLPSGALEEAAEAGEEEREGGGQADELFGNVPATWSRGEVVTAIAFGLAVVGWVFPGLGKAAGVPGADALKAVLHPGVVALFASSILFFVPDGRGERVLPWRRAARIDWGIILLFGGGIALGTQLVDTGLAAAMSRGFVALTGIESLWPLTAVACVFTIFFTEVCSNTASANMLVPLVIAIAEELGLPAAPPALAVGLAAS
ncbi:MAG TPA: DASS family sodium-coupled anion symporter, partial [Sandaracinaceae bacterium LLY-WYZ-13_1]|nr:DASS family sodium-coupled anion symporter [Sandaracinaceae bacterium LLY-WYZ-13_1]